MGQQSVSFLCALLFRIGEQKSERGIGGGDSIGGSNGGRHGSRMGRFCIGESMASCENGRKFSSLLVSDGHNGSENK